MCSGKRSGNNSSLGMDINSLVVKQSIGTDAYATFRPNLAILISDEYNLSKGSISINSTYRARVLKEYYHLNIEQCSVYYC